MRKRNVYDSVTSDSRPGGDNGSDKEFLVYVHDAENGIPFFNRLHPHKTVDENPGLNSGVYSRIVKPILKVRTQRIHLFVF